MAGPIEEAVRNGDYAGARFQVAVKLAGMMDETNDKRYAPMTANRLLDCLDSLESGGRAKSRKPSHSEVSAFEVLAGKRADRRKAAEG